MSTIKDEPLSVTVQRAAFALQQVGYSAEFAQRLMRVSVIVQDAEKLGAWRMAMQQGIYCTSAVLGTVSLRNHQA